MTKRCLRTDPHDCFLGRHLDPPKAVRIAERDFQKQVLEIARLYRWHAYHPMLSKWSERGWPDLAMVRPPRLVFAELKAEKGTVPSTRSAGWHCSVPAPGSRRTSGGRPT